MTITEKNPAVAALFVTIEPLLLVYSIFHFMKQSPLFENDSKDLAKQKNIKEID